jgi:hypothetical protein
VWNNGASISESTLVLGGLVFSAKGNYAWWKIWPRVEDSLFLFLAGKNTPHVWEREVVIEGRKCMSGANRTKVLVQFFVHVRGFQWEQLCTYMGCSGNNHVHMWVAVGTVAYIRINLSG